MCGIGGCIGHGAQAELVQKMSDLIKHRGPDDHGSYVDRGAALFSNRLSIIDLAGGHQPIFNEDENLLIVYNGEVYNFPELRDDLEKKGHRFRTRTDTEVILHGFEQYGPKIFGMLDGMFALAIWNVREKRLILARDRAGIKPLYYTTTIDGDFVFCSEIKGILAHPAVSVSVNEEGLYDLISLYYIPFEQTLYKGIFKLNPGHFYDSSTGKAEAYWQPPKFRQGFVPEIATVRKALEDSVERQLISDVEVGAFLSGGLDTSTIVAFAVKHYPHKLKTFCMGFGMDDDELDDAKAAADFFGTEHYGFTLTDRSAMELYPKMIWHSEQPKVNTYSWFVNEFARKYVKVCLSGLGGDELFFGYPTSTRFVAFQTAQKLMKVPGSSLLSTFASGKRKRVLANLKDRASTYLTTVSPVYDSIDREVFREGVSEPRTKLRALYQQEFFSTNEDFVQQAVYAEFRTKLVDDFLAIDDSMSMAHSLENRVPLLDNQLLDLMLPVSYQYNYENGVGKALLRKAMQGTLPEKTFVKPKQGFSLNILKWWTGELGEEIRRTIPESGAVKQYFNMEYLRQLIPKADDSYSSASLLWHIYAFDLWHKIFVEKETNIAGYRAPQFAA